MVQLTATTNSTWALPRGSATPRAQLTLQPAGSANRARCTQTQSNIPGFGGGFSNDDQSSEELSYPDGTPNGETVGYLHSVKSSVTALAELGAAGGVGVYSRYVNVNQARITGW